MNSLLQQFYMIPKVTRFIALCGCSVVSLLGLSLRPRSVSLFSAQFRFGILMSEDKETNKDESLLFQVRLWLAHIADNDCPPLCGFNCTAATHVRFPVQEHQASLRYVEFCSLI